MKYTIGNTIKLGVQFFDINDSVTPVEVINVKLKLFDSNQTQIGSTISISNLNKTNPGEYFYYLVVPNNPPYIDIEWSSINGDFADVSRDRIEITWYEEDIEEITFTNRDTININNIKSLLNFDHSNYDRLIAQLIPNTLERICDYCRNDFLAMDSSGYISDTCDMVMTSSTITLDTNLEILPGDFIRLSAYKNKLYQVKEFVNGVITLMDNYSMRPTQVYNGRIYLTDFPISIMDIIVNEVKAHTSEGNKKIKVEQIGETKLEYFESNSLDSFHNDNYLLLNQHRCVYRRRL